MLIRNCVCRRNFFIPFCSFACLMLFGLYQIFYGEVIPVAEGLGFDGQLYGPLAGDFFNRMAAMPVYLYVRVLPSFLIFCILSLLNIPPETQHIVKAFQGLNIVLIGLAFWGWWLIVKEMKISFVGWGLGFIALFLNFPMLKGYYFEPVIVDVFGFALSVYCLYFYLVNNRGILIFLAVLSALTWPVNFLIALIFLCFPRHSVKPILGPAPWQQWAAVGIPGIWLLLAAMHFSFLSGIGQIIGVFCAVFYLYFGIRHCLVIKSAFLPIKTKRFASILWAFLFLVVCVLFFRANLLLISLVTSFIRPFNFLLAHILWFGPFIILIVLNWEEICEYVSQSDWAVAVLWGTGFLLSVSGISRHLLAFLIIFVSYTVKVIEKQSWKGKDILLLLTLSLLYSKAWFYFSSFSWAHSGDFGVELYWMSHGQMMSERYYFIQMVITLCVFGFLYACRRGRAQNL